MGVRPRLQAGGRGVFDVRLDGDVVYSRHERGGRFPLEGEVEELLRARLAP